jgi:hypothetical protein
MKARSLIDYSSLDGLLSQNIRPSASLTPLLNTSFARLYLACLQRRIQSSYVTMTELSIIGDNFAHKTGSPNDAGIDPMVRTTSPLTVVR